MSEYITYIMQIRIYCMSTLGSIWIWIQGIQNYTRKIKNLYNINPEKLHYKERQNMFHIFKSLHNQIRIQQESQNVKPGGSRSEIVILKKVWRVKKISDALDKWFCMTQNSDDALNSGKLPLVTRHNALFKKRDASYSHRMLTVTAQPAYLIRYCCN